jgi:rhodanese-related sulfurtransferase
MSNCENIKELITRGWTLVDVREPHEHTNEKIIHSINIRLSDIPNIDKNGKYALYCRSGARSGMAAQFLQSIGVEAVNIGGINQYIGCIE